MLDLSPEEIAVIQRRRDEQATQDARIAFQKKAISTAYSFSNWSDENGYELTFSTFINDYHYQDDDGKAMYEAVKRIQEAAWPTY